VAGTIPPDQKQLDRTGWRENSHGPATGWQNPLVNPAPLTGRASHKGRWMAGETPFRACS